MRNIINRCFKILVEYDDIYVYDFGGRRYDVGEKLVFLEATIYFVLKISEFRDKF